MLLLAFSEKKKLVLYMISERFSTNAGSKLAHRTCKLKQNMHVNFDRFFSCMKGYRTLNTWPFTLKLLALQTYTVKLTDKNIEEVTTLQILNSFCSF